MKFSRTLLTLLLFVTCSCGGDSRESSQLRASLEELRHDMRRLEKRLDEIAERRPSGGPAPSTAATPELAAKEPESAAKPTPAKALPAIEPITFEMDGSEEDDPFLGGADTPRVLMAFANFECATCRDFIRDTLPKLRSEYIDDKKLKFILRDFPLPQQPSSSELAQIAHCAGEQGVYWEAQAAISSAAEEGSAIVPQQLATFLRLKDMKKFLTCVKGTKYRREIERDQMDGERLGVTGIPAFFLVVREPNGEYRGVRIRGAQPFGVFRKAIENIELP